MIDPIGSLSGNMVNRQIYHFVPGDGGFYLLEAIQGEFRGIRNVSGQ